MARSLGADHTLLVGNEDVEVLASQIGATLAGQPDVTVECSGAESSIRLGIFVSAAPCRRRRPHSSLSVAATALSTARLHPSMRDRELEQKKTTLRPLLSD